MTAYNGNAMQNYHQYQKRCFQKGVVINHKSSRIMIVLLHVPKHMPCDRPSSDAMGQHIVTTDMSRA